MTLDKLPDELKSGRVIVATAAQENAGLYTFPGMDDDYRIVTRAGTVTRGDGETVPPPPSGHWHYLTNAAGERIADGAESDEADEEEAPKRETITQTAKRLHREVVDEAYDKKKKAKQTDEDSDEHDCVDCGVSTRGLSHCHTTSHPVEYLCCPCTLKRGHTCSVEERVA